MTKATGICLPKLYQHQEQFAKEAIRQGIIDTIKKVQKGDIGLPTVAELAEKIGATSQNFMDVYQEMLWNREIVMINGQLIVR